MRISLTQHLISLKASGQKALAILIDPDHITRKDARDLIRQAEAHKVDVLMVGGSLTIDQSIHDLIPWLKTHTHIPIVLFPGSILHIVPEADAILLLSLISGRNPDLLIGKHVEAAPLLQASGLELMPTGYMLIDAGSPTTVNYMSNTFPIPHNKPQIAACTALAGEQLGLKHIYMDGGSGAQRTISPQMIRAVADRIRIPLFVGGGIKTGKDAKTIWESGADLIVVGTVLESPSATHLLEELSTEKFLLNHQIAR
ncbi:MAG: geranylgeranylglyceryl/heptaprenylglyceryl phosphate synthase [Bacteroidota bacterium]